VLHKSPVTLAILPAHGFIAMPAWAHSSDPAATPAWALEPPLKEVPAALAVPAVLMHLAARRRRNAGLRAQPVRVAPRHPTRRAQPAAARPGERLARRHGGADRIMSPLP